MSSLSWLQSCECSIQPSDDSGSVSNILHWVGFIFLSPCPQRIMFSAINLLFLLTFTVLALQRLHSKFRKLGTSTLNKPLLKTDNPVFRSSIWFKVSVLVVALFALSYGLLCVLALIQGEGSQWDLVEVLFKFFQLLANLAVLIIITHLRVNGVVSLPMPLRIYWATNFTLMCLFAAAALIRLLSAGESPKMEIDDYFSIASLPLYGFLLIASIKGSSETFFSIKNVNNENSSPEVIESKVSGYATASLFSKAVWNWMNPLLRKGYKSPLQMEEVPLLPFDHRAEKLSELFEQNWPKDQTLIKNNPVRRLLLKCFWKDLAITGFLAIVRLCVMYVGPVLIQGFISVSSGDRSNIYQGFYLILILLVSKVIEVLSAHHFNFLSQKLGMLIRSTLITALYKKGLRLSCSSRQAHGVGQIVNYMGVDCQQLSDLVYQLHTLWMMPFQVGVALLILYVNLGVAVLVTLILVIGVMFITVNITRKNNTFQFHVMMNRDSRMKVTTELLNYMRVIKFQAWEEHFRDKIRKCREKEYSWLSKFMYMVSGNLVLIWSVPLGMSALTFGVATLMRVPLDATTVFTATSIFKILQEPIQSFPQTLMSVSQAIISLERLDKYLISREIRDENVEREENCDGFNAVVVKEGTFGWEDEGGEHVLEDISFEIKKGELAAIVGTVGSGKSSLLASVLGELHKSSGKVTVCGTTAYVAQTSWIQNATIEENILFGSPMDTEKYKDVVRVCCLEKDLEMMEHGDQTEIGERGINLSGGQKQRIQLARAVYQDSDIYLLDDIFSAVDAHTGSEIFKECVRGALKGKTVLLVTHQVDFLHNADIILVLREGKIVQSGKYEELLESGLDFGAIVAAFETSMELVETNSSVSAVNAKLGPKSPRIGSPKSEINGENNESSEQSKSGKNSSKLIEEEERESGRVSLNVYKQYCTEAFGWWGVVAVILASILWQATQMASDYWLAYETSEDRVFVPSLFLGVFSIIAVISSSFIAVRSFLVAILGLRTCQSFFKQILDSILHAPMSFFDTTPSGRVLSRVSSDQVNIDLMIPLLLSIAILMYFTLLSILIITCQYAWPTVFFMIPLIWLNIWYQRYFIASSRELTRLDGVTKAPVIHHFSETISGVMTIRCFRNQEKFIQGNVDRVNSNARMTFHTFASNEWFGFRVELIGSFLLCLSTVFLIFLPSTIVRPEYVGLSLSYGLQLSGVLYFSVYMTSNLENRMVSVERIKQFISIPSEASWRKSDAPAREDWPNRGEIVIKDLQVRYRENTPLVLKGISLTIKGGEKIGVVGRTGSGKSTLIQVFFRLVEPHFGNIIVDGVDISKLGLHDVRSRFGIIPQEPVLFEGTVRSNLDPLGLYSEDDIWKSLERCQLKDVVAAKPEKLDASVVDSGDNWSVGQRQLLCLGRVLLKRSKILFMDEATASVDAQTDALIQNIIRQDFSNCTIITIAHRIPTVIDCDRVLVIDAGWAKEFDNPSNLLARKSLFGALVQEYANRSSSM